MLRSLEITTKYIKLVLRITPAVRLKGRKVVEVNIVVETT